MTFRRTVCALALLACTGLALAEAQPASTTDKVQKLACASDDAKCVTTLHLQTLGIDVRLPQADGWQTAVQDLGTEKRDALTRSDAFGQTIVMLSKFVGPDRSCQGWESFMVVRQHAIEEKIQLIAPKGWYARAYTNPDRSATVLCKDIAGGTITALVPGSAAKVAESQRAKVAAALEEVSRAADPKPRGQPAN